MCFMVWKEVWGEALLWCTMNDRSFHMVGLFCLIASFNLARV